MRGAGRVALSAGVGAVGAIVLSALGVQAEFSWGWGVLLAAAALVFTLQMPDDPRADAPGRAPEQSYVGSDVSRLAWAINVHGDTVSEAVTRRVRATLRRRLARHGVDPHDDSHADLVERHLGAGLWARLNGRRTTIQDIRDALDAAERLSPTDPQDATQRERES